MGLLLRSGKFGVRFSDLPTLSSTDMLMLTSDIVVTVESSFSSMLGFLDLMRSSTKLRGDVGLRRIVVFSLGDNIGVVGEHKSMVAVGSSILGGVTGTVVIGKAVLTFRETGTSFGGSVLMTRGFAGDFLLYVDVVWEPTDVEVLTRGNTGVTWGCCSTVVGCTRAGFGIFETFWGFGMFAWDPCDVIVETKVGGGAVDVDAVKF